jgi:hypothetical protein
MRRRHKSYFRVDTQESEIETITTNDRQVTSLMQYANPTSTLPKVSYSSSCTQSPQVSPQLAGNQGDNTFETHSRNIISLAHPWSGHKHKHSIETQSTYRAYSKEPLIGDTAS